MEHWIHNGHHVCRIYCQCCSSRKSHEANRNVENSRMESCLKILIARYKLYNCLDGSMVYHISDPYNTNTLEISEKEGSPAVL